MRRGKVALALVIALLTVSSALFVAIGGGPERADDRDAVIEVGYDSETFTVATIGEPQYLDPAVDYETAGGEVIQNVYETLIWYDRASVVSLKPMLATAVPSLSNGLISSDGLNYTFNLKAGIKFHDGTVMNADDVEYSIERVLRIHDPDGPSWMMEQLMNDYIQYYVGGELQYFKMDSYNAPWVLDAIGGTADDYIITELDVQNVSEAAVVKVDSDTVTLRLTHPYPAFLSIAAYTVMSIVSKEYVEAHGGIVNGEHNDYMDQNTCGTGPYKLVDWSYGDSINLTRFDDYWGTKPALRDIYILRVDDVYARIQMLQVGDADTAYIPIEYDANFSGDSDFEITKGLPTFNMDFVGFNQIINTTAAAAYGSTVPTDFFASKNVRKAFTHLFDAQTYIADYYKGNAIQPNGVIPAGMFGYNASAPLYDYNLVKAKELLENTTNPGTGHSWWEDGFTIAFIFNAGNLARQTASQYLKQALESLNTFPGTHGTFQATINSLDWPTYLTETRKKPSPLPVFFLGWAPDYADPDDYVNPFLLSYGTYPSRTGYSNATMDSLILSAASEMDNSTRRMLYDQITNLCYDDAPYIWVAQLGNFHIERSWVNGYYFNPMYSGLYYAALSKEDFGNPPIFIVPPPSYIYLGDGEEFLFNIEIADDDGDDINVTWDWGDGSPASTNLSTAGALGEWISQSHAWNVPKVPGYGDYLEYYTLTITLDDGQGYNATRETTIMVYVPENIPPYVGLSLSKSSVEPGENFTIQANATDLEGDPLTWTFQISNGTGPMVSWSSVTPATDPETLVWNNQTYSLGEEDDYWITVNVSDALPPNQVFPHNISQSVYLKVIENTAPFVYPDILISPAAPVIDVSVGAVNVNFSIEAADIDNDALTATWQLGDDVGPVVNVSSAGPGVVEFNQTRVFTETGYYNISVVITDGYAGHEVTRSTVLAVTSNDLPPELEDVVIDYSQIVSALPDEVINITLVFSDPEEDEISGTIDFGDGSPLLQFNVSEYVGGLATIVVNHSYESVGNYTMVIDYTDNETMGLLNHSKSAEAEVVVSDYVIPEFSGILLPILGALTAAMMCRLGRGHRKRT